MGAYAGFFKSQWKLQILQTKEWFYLIRRPRIIKKNYTYLKQMYEKILRILKEDFYKGRLLIENHEGVKEAIEVNQELDDLGFHAEKILGMMFPWRPRYAFFRVLHYHVSQVLQVLEEHVNEDKYEDLVFQDVKDKLNEMEPMVRYWT